MQNHENMRTVYFNGTKFTRHENAILNRWYHPMVLAVQGLPTIQTVQYESRNHIVVSGLVCHFPERIFEPLNTKLH